jgi:WD40 repeat protein
LWAVGLTNPARAHHRATLPAYNEPVRCLAFQPDGKRLVSGSWGQHLLLWDVRTAKLINVVARGARVLAVAFHPTGNLLAWGAYMPGSVYALPWPQAGQQVPALLGSHPWGIFALAFSPDGSRLASGDGDGVIKLWEPTERRELATLPGSKGIYSLAFSPDGGTLASGSLDGAVRWWDVGTGRERRAFQWQVRWVTSVAFSPDGMTAAAGTKDHTVVVWDVEA